ncbi:protein S40-7-like [Phragmites australis]|uniref:protein S40-7-like n=1 Tax=Phragmites australis TaxID=29695 RepID=UPI002D77B3C7|nr:protein S40-7-like [Phragmites australis]
MSTPRRRLATTSPSLRFLGLLKQPDDASADVQELELDERDVVWSSSTTSSSSTSAASSPSLTPSPSPSAGLRRPISTSSRHFPAGSIGLSALLADEHAPTASIPATMRSKRQQHPQPYHQSAPVAVPVWPKGRTTTTTDRRRREAEQEADDEDDDGEPVVHPHEMVARRAAAAASVMEGAGRTLKGRDLRRVRNAVWRTTGFLDL